MLFKYLMLVTIATISLLFSPFTLSQSEQMEAKKAEVQRQMQQRIEDRCGDDQDCIEKMKSHMAEKKGTKGGDRDSAKQQMFIEKRCGDDQDCIDKMKSRMAEKKGAKGGERDSAKQQMFIEKRCGDDQDCIDKMKSRMAERESIKE